MSRISVDVNSARIPVLQVGYQGENEVTDVLFDISSWITEFGEGVAQLRVKRPGNSEEESYVLSLTITDGKAVWTVSETDTANKGNGKVQLSYMVGNIVKKAVIYPYKVGKSIVGADNPVDPFDSWIERSKAWAIGKTLDGNDVPETDETYQNNAKYYAEQADTLGSAQVVLATEQATLATAKATLATEKADAAAASEAAVNGVSTQLTTRMSAIETEQAVQDARMDTFTSLPEGSTSGNAELADIRVGADGTTYNTAGNAVRGQISELKSDLDALYKSIEIPSDYLKAWIRYSNGEQVTSSATMLYTFTGHLPKSIKAFLTSDTNVLCAIAFYNSTTISTESYMQSESIVFLDGNHDAGAWYNAIVPDDCKLIAITTKKPSDTIPQPIIKFSRGLQYDFGSPFENKMCFGHLFVNQTNASFSSNIIIPCQSIFDVQITARLGFKYIEANVHKTSDGKYVVTHGINGKLGNDFEKVSDGSQVSDVVISDTTFEVLRTDYCYRSNYDKYKVPITSLEEFLHECKRWGISVVLQYIDETELAIAKGIIGENIILYNGARNVWDGYIMDYLSLTTKEDIVKRCKEVGKPYMYNMANPTAFTDTELKEIISAVHDLGCYIGFTGAYQSKNNIPKYIDYGFDFNASSMQVNDFELGNLYNCYGDLDFSDIVHTGTVENGVLHLADGQYIQWTENANFLTKVSMHITFSGKLYYMGVASGIFIESDGDNSMWHSIFYNNETPFYKWVSNGDTYIKNITVKASKC